MQKQLNYPVKLCTDRRVRVNPKNSTSLFFKRVPKSKKVVRAPIELSIEGTPNPQMKDNFERVLGVHMQHTVGVDDKTDAFCKDLELV